MKMHYTIGLALTCLVGIASSGSADTSGKASVIDGDTLRIDEERIRLHGIDAPEQQQMCVMDGGEFACGKVATAELRKIIGSHVVDCVGQKRDHYNRLIAVCYVGSTNLNEEMVREGWALAYRRYTRDYISAEREAERNLRGIWRGDFISPWDWRKRKKISTSSQIDGSEGQADDTGSSANSSACCKVCTKGKPCGNSCITKTKICRAEPGCAC